MTEPTPMQRELGTMRRTYRVNCHDCGHVETFSLSRQEARDAARAAASNRAIAAARLAHREKTRRIVARKVREFSRAPSTMSRFWPGAQFETPRDLLARIRFDAGAAPESDRRAALIVAWQACRAERADALIADVA